MELAIIHLVIHAHAIICAKFAVMLDIGQKAWASMVLVCITLVELKLQGRCWKGMPYKDKWLASNWSKLLLGSLIRELVKKCKKVAKTLDWGENERYIENSLVHQSSWLSKQGLRLENLF